MRLIDADALIEFIDLGHLRHPDELAFSELDVVNMLNHAPTAYDVDKVVGELKRDKFIESECILSDVHQGYNAGLSRAIEIVKGGGN